MKYVITDKSKILDELNKAYRLNILKYKKIIVLSKLQNSPPSLCQVKIFTSNNSNNYY